MFWSLFVVDGCVPSLLLMGACCGKEEKSEERATAVNNDTPHLPEESTGVDKTNTPEGRPSAQPTLMIDDEPSSKPITSLLSSTESDQPSATAIECTGSGTGSGSQPVENDMPSITLDPEQQNPNSLDKDGPSTFNIGTRVTLDPRSRIVETGGTSSARKARRPMRKDESGAVADKRRRDSVHQTIYKLGGFITDRKTGKQIYIAPDTPFESSIKTPKDTQSSGDE